MHRPRYYRNPALYLTRGDPNAVRFGFNSLSQTARNTYRRASTTPFSPSHNRFVDRSKYVWTANKQQTQPSLPAQPTQITQPTSPIPPTQPTPPIPQTQPTQPTQPVQPVQPVQPAKPTQLAQPTPPPKSDPKPFKPSAQPPIQSKPVLLKKNNLILIQKVEPLSVSISDSPEAVAIDIAAKLKEEKTYLIKKVVEVIGVKKAIRLFYDTRLKEAHGGILVQNGIRRRTPGGVFLTLLRESNYISGLEVNRIFQEIKRYELKLKLTNSLEAS